MGSTIIKGLKVGTDYKFQVRAVNAYGDKGQPSPEIVHTAPKDETAPATPASVSVGVQGKHIHIEVPKQSEDDFAGFEFHASTTTGFTPSDATLIQKGNSNTCDFLGAAWNQTWYIKVCSYDTSGNKSAYTAQQLIVTANRWFISAPNSAPADGDLAAAECTFYLDETTNTLKVRVKYTNGTTLKSGSITLA